MHMCLRSMLDVQMPHTVARLQRNHQMVLVVLEVLVVLVLVALVVLVVLVLVAYLWSIQWQRRQWCT